MAAERGQQEAARLILSGVKQAEVRERLGMSRWEVFLAARRARGGSSSLRQARRLAAGEPAPEVERADLRARQYRGTPACPVCRLAMRACRC